MHTASLLISLDWIIYKPAESIGLAGKKEGALSGHTKESFSKNRARESSFTNESIRIYYLLKRAHFLGLDPGVQKFHPVTLPQRHCPYQVKRLRSRASRTMKTFSTSMELHLFELVQIALIKIDHFCVRISLGKDTFCLYVNG